MTMVILSPPGLSIANQTQGWKRPHRGCQPHGPSVWAGVPQSVVSDLPWPTPSHTSSDSSEPSSLESLTEPESGYEASVSSNLSSGLE